MSGFTFPSDFPSDPNLERLHQKIKEQTAAIVEAILRIDETEVSRMLGQWVSELEPALAYGPNGQLLGLTSADIPVGVIAPIVVKVSEEYKRKRANVVPPWSSGV